MNVKARLSTFPHRFFPHFRSFFQRMSLTLQNSFHGRLKQIFCVQYDLEAGALNIQNASNKLISKNNNFLFLIQFKKPIYVLHVCLKSLQTYETYYSIKMISGNCFVPVIYTGTRINASIFPLLSPLSLSPSLDNIINWVREENVQ